jgi:hypothetical protein
MPPVVDAPLALACRQYHHMSCARANLLITARTPVRLGGARRRDRVDLVLVTVRPDFDPARRG